MGFPSAARLAGLGAVSLIIAFALPHIPWLIPDGLVSFVTDFPFRDCPSPVPLRSSTASQSTTCEPSAYRTEIVSLDPLLIYIHSFLPPSEIDSLLATADPLFAPSQVTKNGRKQDTSDRTSSTAGLPTHDETVRCVLGRATEFMGTMMRQGVDEMGPPQLVRYTAGQKFNIHHDWYESPQWAYDGSRRRFNRVASFFAILQDNCTGGETHFPRIESGLRGAVQEQGAVVPTPPMTWEESDPVWRAHEKGGLAFRPVAGNAVFWVNLHANGTGDDRTLHAGLPVGDGLKTAMNIWPRKFYQVT